MKRSASRRRQHLVGLAAALVCAAALGACGSEEGAPAPERPFVAAPDTSTPLSASFKVTVDPQHPALQTTHREPQEGPVTVTGQSGDVEIIGHAKTISIRPDTLWVDLYVVNKSPSALRDLRANITAEGGAALFDLSEDPLAETPIGGEILIGGAAAEGVAHFTLGVPAGSGPIQFDLALSGQTTTRRPASSSPVQVTPDGSEAWLAFPDGNVVAVIDTATDERVTQVEVPGKPTSVAITGDGALVLVTSEDANTVTIIDRESKKVLQTLDEAAGIGRQPQHVVASSDGARAYVSAYVGDRITALERLESGKFRVASTLQVGRRPAGMSLSADGQTLLVSHFLPRGTITDNESWVSVVQTAPLALDHEAVIRDDANLEESKCLADLFQLEAKDLLFEGVNTELSGVFLDPGGNVGWIPALRFGPVPVWEVPAGVKIPGVSTLFTPQFTVFLNTRDPAATAPKLHPGVVDPPDANLAYMKCAKLSYQTEATMRQPIDGLPGQQLNTGAATPSGMNPLSDTGASRFVGFTRGGRRALVLSYLADEILVLDAVTQHATTVKHFMLSGSNPTGVAVTPDGAKGYVAYENSTFTSVLDLGAYADPAKLPVASYVPYEFRKIDGQGANSVITRQSLVRFTEGIPELPPIAETAQIKLVDKDPLDAKLRRGRVLFNSSNPDKYPTLSWSRQGACAACHPHGGNDGVGWGTMEGERRTLSLYGGVGGRGWLHQSGTHSNADEFVRTVVPERLSGTGLSDDDYAALADYLAWGIPRLQSPPTDAQLVAKGKQVFAAKCASCHSGDKLTGGNPDPNDPLGGGVASGPLLVDVGTARDDLKLLIPETFTTLLPPPTNTLYAELRGDRDLGEGDLVQQTIGFRQRPNRKRGEIRPPSLVNVWDNVLFFHDGRFDKMEDAVGYLNKKLGLGLSADDTRAVVEYMKTL